MKNASTHNWQEPHRRDSCNRTLLLGLAFPLFLALACDADDAPGPFHSDPSDSPSIDLAISKSVNVASPVEGTNVIYTVRVRNNGPVRAEDVLAADTLSDGMTYVAHEAEVGNFNANPGIWTIGTLEVDQEVGLELTAQVSQGTAGSPIRSSAGVISTSQHDSIIANNVASATITPREQGESVDIVFRSAWDHSLGSENNALMDGRGGPNWRWNEFFCSGRHDVLEVVRGSDVGWSLTPNVLRINHTGVDGDCGAIQAREVVPAQTTHWGRMYFNSDLENWGGAYHNFSYNFLGDIQMVFFRPNGEAAGWFVGFSFDYAADGGTWSSKSHPEWARGNWLLQTSQANPSDPAEYTGLTSPNRIILDHGAWYRYEWMIEYVTATTFRFWPRVYDATGTLLYDADDFYNVFWLGESLSEYYAGGGAFGLSSASLMRNIGIGNEGRSGGSEAF